MVVGERVKTLKRGKLAHIICKPCNNGSEADSILATGIVSKVECSNVTLSSPYIVTNMNGDIFLSTCSKGYNNLPDEYSVNAFNSVVSTNAKEIKEKVLELYNPIKLSTTPLPKKLMDYLYEISHNEEF